MKKFFATFALVVATVALTSYNNVENNDQVSGDTNSTQMNEPGLGAIRDI